MTSRAKVEANRKNAQKSTGPRTPSGKAVASMNALKHGLCAHTPVVPGEDPAEFAQFAAGWVDHLQPSDPHQTSLAEQLILAAWQLKRVPLLRAGLIAEQMYWETKRSEPIHPWSMSSEAHARLSRIDRHQVVLERTFRQCLQELKELQSADSAEDDRLETAGSRLEERQNEATEQQMPRIHQDTGGGVPVMYDGRDESPRHA